MSRPDFSLATLNWGNPELLTPSSAQSKPLGHWELTEGGRRGEGSVRTARQEGTASLQQQHKLHLPQRNPQPIAPVPTGFHTDQQQLLQQDRTLHHTAGSACTGSSPGLSEHIPSRTGLQELLPPCCARLVSAQHDQHSQCPMLS